MKTTAADIPLAERMRGAIWGAFVGDAACLGSHWIYDLTELAKTFPAGVHGFEPSRPGHYHFGKQSGELTHYGDAALLLLASVAEMGHFDAIDFGRRFLALMTASNYGGYRDHATKGTIDRYRAFTAAHPDRPFDYQQGADDDQPATVTRLTPLVAAHWQDKGLPGDGCHGPPGVSQEQWPGPFAYAPGLRPESSGTSWARAQLGKIPPWQGPGNPWPLSGAARHPGWPTKNRRRPLAQGAAQFS